MEGHSEAASRRKNTQAKCWVVGPRGMAVSWAEAGKGPQAAGGSAAGRPARACCAAKGEGSDFILRVAGSRQWPKRRLVQVTKREEAVGARWKQAAGGDPGDPFLADIYVYSASN